MPQATLCRRTFSTGENGKRRCGESSLKMPKPMRLAGMDMMDTQPVCRPKYMLEKQMTVPTASPARTALTVKLRPGIDLVTMMPKCRCRREAAADAMLLAMSSSAVVLAGSRRVDVLSRESPPLSRRPPRPTPVMTNAEEDCKAAHLHDNIN